MSAILTFSQTVYILFIQHVHRLVKKGNVFASLPSELVWDYINWHETALHVGSGRPFNFITHQSKSIVYLTALTIKVGYASHKLLNILFYCFGAILWSFLLHFSPPLPLCLLFCRGLPQF